MLGEPASPLLWNINGNSPDEQSLPLWCAYTGQSKEVARDWGWLHALHPRDRKTVRGTWKQIKYTPHPVTLSCQVRHFRQGYQPFKILHVPLFDEKHRLQNWLLFFTKEPDHPPEIDEDWEIRLMYGMIFTQVVLGIFCLSLDGTILRVNNQLCQLTGYTEDELLSMTIWQLSPPEDVQIHLQAIQGRLTSGHSYPPFRTRYRRKDGTPLWVEVTQFLVRQPSGEPYYLFFTVEDVSAEVRAEEEHAKLLARVQDAHKEALARTRQVEAAFEAITDGILVSDSQERIVQSNAAARRILHLDAHPEFLRLPSVEERVALLKAIDERGHEVARDEWPLARLLRGETLGAGRTEDVRLSLPDGQEIYVNYSGASMRDESNQIVGAALVIHDVTERHLLENRVQKSFKILLSLAEELVEIPKNNSTKPLAEAEQLPFAYSVQAASQHMAELTHQVLEYRGSGIALRDPETGLMRLVAIAGYTPEERDHYCTAFAQSIPADYLNAGTMERLNKNEVAIEDLAIQIHDARPYKMLHAPMMLEGRLVGVLAVEKAEPHTSFTNEEIGMVKALAKLILLVIERERIQREWLEVHSSELALRETNRRFDEFLSIASHELRTPLAGIKGNIQLALRRLAALKSQPLPEIGEISEKLDKMQDYLLQAEHRVNVQNRMISDLLDVSRIQANRLELVMGPCDVRKIVQDAVKDQQYAVPERVITLDAPDTEILVIGDADRIGQVVHNYLTNALKYSTADRPVSASIGKGENSVRVSVSDQGPGLTPEEQKRVWERFYRAKGIMAQGGSGPGLGLGLHICRTIIESHQGQIGLESTPGKGSTFWFTLPLAPTDSTSAEQPTCAYHEPAPKR